MGRKATKVLVAEALDLQAQQVAKRLNTEMSDVETIKGAVAKVSDITDGQVNVTASALRGCFRDVAGKSHAHLNRLISIGRGRPKSSTAEVAE